MGFTIISIGLFVIFFFVVLLFLASRYRRCPSNKILAVYGKVGENQSVRCFHGGGTFIWPLVQDSRFLDLNPMTINIPLKGALSLQNIRINVPSTFTVAVDTSPQAMNNAAIRLLELSREDIERMATEIIFGQLRLTVASLTIEEINKNRERFLEAIRKNIDTELLKIGLTLINVNITDITDESGYIESIGKKAAATAVNQAKVDVAEQVKTGAIGAASAEKTQRIQVASFNAQAVEGENTAQADVAKFNADLAEREASARQRGEVANQQSIAQIQTATAVAEEKRLMADEVVPREIEKRKVEIDAEAEAQKQRKTAAGEADAIVAVRSAEATGIQRVLDAKASGYKALVTSAKNDPKAAATLLMVEKLEEIVKLQTDMIKNIKIDKITVWDSGHGEKGSTTANFMSSFINTLPPIHDVARMAGVDLPGYLGQVSKGGERPLPPPVGETPPPGNGDGEPNRGKKP